MRCTVAVCTGTAWPRPPRVAWPDALVQADARNNTATTCHRETTKTPLQIKSMSTSLSVRSHAASIRSNALPVTSPSFECLYLVGFPPQEAAAQHRRRGTRDYAGDQDGTRPLRGLLQKRDPERQLRRVKR